MIVIYYATIAFKSPMAVTKEQPEAPQCHGVTVWQADLSITATLLKYTLCFLLRHVDEPAG